MNNTGKIILLAAGAILGGAAGVLLAPGKGSDTFKKMVRRDGKLVRGLKNAIKKGKKELAHLQKSELESVR